MPWGSSLGEFFVLAGCVCLLVVFLFLFGLYGRLARSKRPSASAPLSNLTEIAILFQTMRGVIHEQKTLAREFNESVDKKVQIIRQVVKRVLEEHERLTKAHQELDGRIEAVKGDLHRIEEHLARAGGEVFGASARPSPVGFQPSSSQGGAAPRGKAPQDPMPLHAVAKPSEMDSSDDLIDRWVGLDFGLDETEPESLEDLDVPVCAPQAPDTSRQAVQALLNMPGNGGGRSGADPILADGGNGRNRGALRTRVFEYYDAGMSVAQIAQELGVGKGEIRLMLSLREKGKKD
jgi:hypothetical protein